MPRPTRLYGRPGTRVIPTGWGASHQPVTDGTRTADCTVSAPAAPAPGTMDPTTGKYPTSTQTPHYTGSCRVQALTTTSRLADAGERTSTIAGYLVTVPITVAAAVIGHIVKVTNSGDPALDGHTLTVTDVVRGSLLFERGLLCDFTN